MIQAPLPKPIELPKARPKRADSEIFSNQKAPMAKKDSPIESSKASTKKKTEFDKELDEKVSEVEGNKEFEVKAVKVPSDQTVLIQNGSVETTIPKIFDSSLTKDVQQLIYPKTTEVAAPVLTDEQIMALANGEVVAEEIKGELDTEEIKGKLVTEEIKGKLAQNGSVETTIPKIFKPAFTKDFQQLINPKTTEVAAPILTDEQVMALANGEVVTEDIKVELVQAMLKTPQIAEEGKGRSPAIEFAQSEIDPQLLNNEDFVAQKNAVNKKAHPDAYGMKTLPRQQKVALEAGLAQSQVVKEASATDDSAVNSQQFILNMQQEQKTNQTNETQAAPKVFGMNQVKSSDSNKIMDQITDYMVQAKASKEPTVHMRVNHEQLGMLDITVSKSGVGQENIAINIGAHTADGKNFFQQNSKDLFAHLSSAGLNVTDMKVETPSQTAKNDFDFGSQSGKNQQSSDKQFGSESGQRRHDQDRRQDLWKLLNQEAA